ncbi:hypothetical protein Unana1_02942 [Umbelopsis nana]
MSKVYVIGGTGGVGSPTVKELLEKGVSVTVLVRDPTKAATLFGQPENLKIVQGDYTSYDSFKESISGHERLFLLVHDFNDMVKIKATYAKLAYEAGVKQIVDISSASVSGPWRQTFIATEHFLSEDIIFRMPDRGTYVALRPTQFYTNHFFNDHNTVRSQSTIFGCAHPDLKSAWISPNDIAHLAANILTEPIEKHRDSVYDMTGELVSANDRAQILSRVLGKTVNYVQVPNAQQYKVYTEIVHMPHYIAYGLIDGNMMDFAVNEGLPVVLGRPTESLEAWYTANIERFT